MKTDPLSTVYDDESLRIRYLPGRFETLVVSFSGVGEHRYQEPDIEFFRTASGDGDNHVLFVTDESRCWLNKTDMIERILVTIRQTVKATGAKRVVALGNSMGGTMALIVARYFAFDAVIAIAPQYSVDPDVVPDDPRWSFFRRQIQKFRFSAVDRFRADRTKYFLLHSGTRTERRQALRFPEIPGVAQYMIPDAGHDVASELKQKEALDPLIRYAIGGKPRKFRRAMQRVGGQIRPAYVEQMIQAPKLPVVWTGQLPA